MRYSGQNTSGHRYILMIGTAVVVLAIIAILIYLVL
jgi:hypothetical protein